MDRLAALREGIVPAPLLIEEALAWHGERDEAQFLES